MLRARAATLAGALRACAARPVQVVLSWPVPSGPTEIEKAVGRAKPKRRR